RKSWAPRAADENVVVQIPDRCLTGVWCVKQIVWIAVTVKVGCSCQRPAPAGELRPIIATNYHSARQIPHRGLARAVLNQIIRMAVAIKIRYTAQAPAVRKR